MRLKSVIVKLVAIPLLFYWMLTIGGRILTPIYLAMILFYLLSLKYKFLPHQELFETLGIFTLGFAIRFVTIRNAPNPPIDVYTICSQAIDYLIKGANPYTSTYIIPPEQVLYPNPLGGCPYPPLMLWALMPGQVIGGDLRYSILLADLLVAFLLYLFPEDDRNLGLFMALIYLLNPFSVFIIRFAWNEAILIFSLVATLFLWKKGQNNFSAILLGLSLGIKQFSLLIIPFMWKRFSKKQIIMSILVGVLTYMPYLALSPYNLIYDVFLYFGYVRFDSKSFIPMILRYFWVESNVPSMVRTIITLIQLIVTGYTILRLLERSDTSEKIAYSYGLTFFIFIILSPIANINYFYLPPVFFILGASEIISKDEKENPITLKDVFLNPFSKRWRKKY